MGGGVGEDGAAPVVDEVMGEAGGVCGGWVGCQGTECLQGDLDGELGADVAAGAGGAAVAVGKGKNGSTSGEPAVGESILSGQAQAHMLSAADGRARELPAHQTSSAGERLAAGAGMGSAAAASAAVAGAEAARRTAVEAQRM